MRREKWCTWILLLMLLYGCEGQNSHDELYGLPGAWMLSSLVYPEGVEQTFPCDGVSLCRIFGKDTTYYDCRLCSTASGIVIIPQAKGDFEVIYKGNNEFLYFEDGNLRPLTMVDDTTLIIQKHGVRYTWVRNCSMTESRINGIRDIVANDSNDVDAEVMRYVLSTSERELKATNNMLAYIVVSLCFIVFLIMYYLLRLFLHKKYIEKQLQQMTEMRDMRPQLVKNALKQVEDDFFRSTYYKSLQKRVVAGETLKPEDWDEMERAVRPVYPDFIRQLSDLCKMSQVEYHVNLLIKLRFTPSEIAGVLCKDISTVSSIRSRLYRKVFNRKSSSKEWDEFILSL